MKTALLSVCLLLMLTLELLAQVPFPTDNAVWTNTEYTYTFNPPNPIPNSELTDLDVYCVNGQDTTIQSNLYTKVYYCQYIYKGALREENSVVYFVPADSAQEYLLYDFSAQIGQTLEDVYVGNHFDESFMLQDFTVQQIGTEVFGGVSRRVVYAADYRWIEGIGCETGLFMEPWANVSMYEVRLECFTLDDQMVYPTSSTEPCPFVFVDVNDRDATSLSVEAFPNPTNGTLTIAFGQSQTFIHISILNVFGQEVERLTVLNTDRTELSIEGAAGLYFATVTAENGERSTLRIVKN